MAKVDKGNSLFVDVLAYLKSRKLWLNVLIMVLLTAFLVWLVFFGLKQYTNHGQQLILPDYVNKPLELAQEDAKDRSFQIIVEDSVFIIGEEGGIIKRQNPNPKAKVKEGRKIYVTITKYGTENVSLSSLPRLYGEQFELKEKELSVGFDLNSQILGHEYDPGPEGHIMKVVYKGDTIINASNRQNELEIPKGATLGFILSKSEGAVFPIPNLECKTLIEAKFQLEALQLVLGKVDMQGATEDTDAAFIINQSPTYSPDKKIRGGDTINVVVTPLIPENCE